MRDIASTVLNWLAANRVLFGVPAENWMLVIGGALLLYIGALAISARRHRRVR